MSQHIPDELFEQLVALRRDIHQHPELSWEEERTADVIEARLRALGLTPRRMAGTGVVAEIPGASDGPMVALRADTDALPVHEDTGLAFASIHEGVMHACGHDGHTTMLLGAAELLLKGPPPPLPVRLLWQPAEEKGAGAPAMIREGVLDGVEMIFGGHVDRRYPAGVLIVTEGPVNASTDTFHLTIRGQSGHGARPHEALDAIVVGSLLVTAIQTVVSREVNPAHPSVISVGRFQAGSAPNVIAGHAILEGTIRAQETSVRDHLRQSIKRIADAIGQLHGAQIDVEVRVGTPALHNTAAMTALAATAAVDVVGREKVTELRTANMGGEDFAYFLEHVEGCYIRFGSQVLGRESFPAHSGQFDIDERALGCGAAWFAAIARRAGEAVLARR